jgi:hypothetical protein
VSGFNKAQTDQLLKPIAVQRVLRDGKGNSHVSQQDVTAHLIDVCYRAALRLTVRDEHGRQVCEFEDGATHTAQNQTRGDAHDLAYKSALSLSKKRCAINLGDQFGLSLYNKGQMSALVIGTLVHPDEANEAGDVEKDVPQQLVMGNDEIDAGEAS